MSSRHLAVLVFTVAIFCFAATSRSSFAQNAALSISPSIGTYPVGESFTVDVRINTGGVAVGTTDVTIAYDPQDVRYVGLSDQDSVFSTILVDSTREYGKLDISAFVGRDQAPYIGQNGLVARVTFIPLRNTATQIRFAKGGATPPLTLGASLGSLANIISTLESATYSFIPRERAPAAVALTTETAHNTTDIITPLPATKNDWFGTSTVTLSWSPPSNVTSVRTGVSKNPNATPEKVHERSLSEETLTDLEEGKQYFLLQFEMNGAWGDVLRYPLQVDVTEPTDIVVREVERSDQADPRTAFAIEATDALSGIDYYMMSFNGEEPEKWVPTDDGLFKPDGLSPGEHVLLVEAYDKAGNSASVETVFLVRSLESPNLHNESVPDRVLVGDTITVRGATYPNAEVTTYIALNDGEASERRVRSDAMGEFVVTVTEGARAGRYTIWFTVKDERGAVSPASVRRSIDVSQPYIMLFGSIAVTYLSVIVPLIALIFLLGLILWLAFTWARSYRSRVKRETGEAYQVVRDEFESLRKELIKQIGMLERANQSRELTREEMRIFTDLSKRLDVIEQRIANEIDDIEYVHESEVRPSERETTVEGALHTYREKLKTSEAIVNETHVLRL